MKALFADFADNIFSFTEHVPTTLRDLVINPGRILRGLRDGDTKRYLSPFKLYVSATLVFFLFIGLTGLTFVQVRVDRIPSKGPPRMEIVGDIGRPIGFRITDIWLHPESAAPRDAEVVAVLDRTQAQLPSDGSRAFYAFFRAAADSPDALNDTIATWAPRVLWLLMPLYALLLWPLYRRGTLAADHFIFALWAHTSLFLLLMVGGLANILGLGHGLLLALVLFQAYLTVGLKGYYGRSWAGAAFKGALHSTVYFGLVWLPLTIGFFLWQAARHLPAGYFVE